MELYSCEWCLGALHQNKTKVVLCSQSVGLTTLKLPDYLRKINYQEPQDAFDSLFQYANETSLHHFEWLKENPVLHAAFNRFMAVTRLDSKQNWFEFIPIGKLAISDVTRPLLVDVGGGHGYDLIAFDKYSAHLPGKLYLQDLPSVIEEAQAQTKPSENPGRVEMMPHDFFKPQPVKNAKAYYMRTILHDWPDEACLSILKNIRDAMGPDSLLLINENVMPDKDAVLFQAWLDFVMMSNFSAKERTQQQWLELLERGGFEVLKVWKPEAATIGSGVLFETRLKDNVGADVPK